MVILLHFVYQGLHQKLKTESINKSLKKEEDSESETAADQERKAVFVDHNSHSFLHPRTKMLNVGLVKLVPQETDVALKLLQIPRVPPLQKNIKSNTIVYKQFLALEPAL